MDNLLKTNAISNGLILWLKFVAIAHIIGGISLATNWPTFLWDNYRLELFQSFSLVHSIPENTHSIVTMLTQLFGPTIASWGMLLFYSVGQIQSPLVQKPISTLIINRPPIIDGLIIASLLWFTLDTLISINFNMLLHVYINSVAILVILLPLLFLRFFYSHHSFSKDPTSHDLNLPKEN